MKIEFVVRDLFKLSDGKTVLACEGADTEATFAGRSAKLMASDKVRQTIVLTGRRQMLNQSVGQRHAAFETREMVNLSAEEVKSGLWSLVIGD